MDAPAGDRQGAEAGGQAAAARASARHPPVVIEPSGSRLSLGLREVWSHRELLYFLVWRDLKVRYKQTALGVAWVIFQPMLMTVVFTVVLGNLGRIPSDGVPYPLFAYVGITLWTFFSGAIAVTGNSLVGNAHLITKVYFPRLIIPVASVAARLVDFGVALVILVGLMAYYHEHVRVSWRLLAAAPLVLLLALLSLGFGMWLSAVNVKYRDIGIALPVLIQLWMFLSPVVYSSGMVPPRFRLVYSLNPAVGILDGFRAALFGAPFYWPALLVSAAFTLALLPYAAYAFQRREKTFADII